MYKVDMLKLLTTVALLTAASVLEAAPLMPGEPEAFDGDLKRTGADEINTVRAKLLRTRPMTTFPDGDGKTVAMRAIDEIITATISPSVRDKTLATGVNNRLKTLTVLYNGRREIDGSLRRDRTTRSPDSPRHTEKNRRIRLSEAIASDEPSKSDPVSGNPQARQELLKMMSALEEFHKLVNSTLSHRITFITKGNSNVRGAGKKNKMVVTDGNLKSTTATTLDSGGISPKASTDQMDPKLNGKAFKKSLPSAKKTNKRVCFWKYCSQN
ncbi:urotensin II-related peptide [Pseudorasbora parva]|uniref:urotensin II-related peptide n=1 Tax=Pseudorasbora parva TaxID=51549 RepID=UPI00351EA149